MFINYTLKKVVYLTESSHPTSSSARMKLHNEHNQILYTRRCVLQKTYDRVAADENT